MDKEEPQMIKTIRSVSEFTEWVEGLEKGKQRLYKGLADANWDVEASARRRFKDPLKVHSEEPSKDIPDDIFQNYVTNILEQARMQGLEHQDGLKLSDLELLAKLQHYGAATCLIDFTANPLIALWFACKDKTEKNGKVATVLTEDPEKFGSVTSEQVRERKITNFLKSQKVWRWEPSGMDNRIIAQRSVFIFGEQEINQRCDYIKIPAKCKKLILETLVKHGITEESLFSDFLGFALSNAHDKPYKDYTAEDYFYWGLKFQQRNQHDKAIQYYKKAIQYYKKAIQSSEETEPYVEYPKLLAKYAEAHNNIGNAKLAKGDFAGAIEAYTEAINTIDTIDKHGYAINPDPEFPNMYINRGIAKKGKGDMINAITDYGTAITKLKKMITNYYEIIERNPNDVKVVNDCLLALRYLGNAYAYRGNIKQGEGDWDDVYEDLRKHSEARKKMSEMYSRLNSILAKDK